MVFLLPASPVHAASPTVNLSTQGSSGALTAATSGTVYSTLVITGSGFVASHPIAITSLVGTSTTPIDWLTGATCASPYGSFSGSGVSTLSPPVDSLVTGSCLTTDADGSFQVSTLVPILPGGTNSISITDGTNTVTKSFSITPQIVISSHDLSGFPGQALAVTSTGTACGTVVVCLTGFGSGDTVVTSSSFTSSTSVVSSTGITVGSTAGTYGVATLDSGTAFYVSDTTGGTKTLTATDTTNTALTASVSFTVNPWIAFYDAQGGVTTYSVAADTPLTSLFLEGHGFPAGTISADSITVGGSATTHNAVTVSSVGTIGAGLGTAVQLGPPTGGFALGNLAVVVDGITFSYAAGNIVYAVNPTTGIYASSGPFGAQSYYAWGGPLIGSVKATALTGTAFIGIDKSSYMPGTPSGNDVNYGPSPNQNQIGIFGYGFESVASDTPNIVAGSNTPALGAVTYTPGYTDPGTCAPSTGVNCVDANGAFFATTTLGDTPFSNASPATSTATSYGIKTSATNSGDNPATIITPSFTVTPWIDVGTVTGFGYVNYESSVTWTVHGFGNLDVVTYKIGGTGFPTAESIQVSSTGTGTATASKVPDLAGGLQTATATGSLTGQVATATGAIIYFPIADTTSGTTFSINSVGAGSTSSIRTGNGYGIHGLAANTAYDVIWNAVSGSQTLGTFTSTSTGGIPVPGVSFTVPTDSAGYHVIDIQTASGVSAIYGETLTGDAVPSVSGSLTSAYGDLVFANIALLQSSPSVASIGFPETLSGSGLAAGTTYVVAIGTGAGTVALNAQALGTFVATSAGAVPSGTTISLPDMATGTETGTLMYLSVQTASHFGANTHSDAYAQFVLASSASLNMTTAPAGHSVTLTAHALNGGGSTAGVYKIIFNYQLNLLGSGFTGTPVGVVAANSVGAGSANFVIPANTPAGTYTVQLVVSTAAVNAVTGNGLAVGSAILNTPLSVTVGSVSTSCNTTSCVAVSGTPVQTTEGVYNGVSSSFTNNSNAPVSGVVYAVVHNALGQTVDISTASISAPAGGTASAFNVLFGLPPGTYSVSLFVTSTSGTAISTQTTVSVTIA